MAATVAWRHSMMSAKSNSEGAGVPCAVVYCRCAEGQMEATKEENIRSMSGVAGSSLGLVYTAHILGGKPRLDFVSKK